MKSVNDHPPPVNNSTDFLPVSKERPCVICSKEDWCRRSDDDCAECHRNADHVSGFKRLKVTSSGYGLYRTDDAPLPKSKRTFATIESAVDSLLSRTELRGGKPTTYTYHKPDGSTSFVIVRLDYLDGKTFRPIHPSDGSWVFGDPPGKLCLFALPGIATASRVFVVEGEKASLAGSSIGLTCTTSSHGSKSPAKSDWTPLAGRECVILPDNDQPGSQYAESVARILTGLNPPATVRVVHLPGLPDAGDIVDWIEDHDSTDSDDLRHAVEVMADAATPWTCTDNPQPTDSLPDAGPSWLTVSDIGSLPSYREGLQPITTGYGCIDDVLSGGFRPECMYVLAGRTGTSKSTFALNIARRVALSGHSVLVFKLEESPTEAVWKMHAAASQVSMRVLLNGVQVAGTDRDKLADGWDLIRSLPIRFADNRSLDSIRRISKEHVNDGGKLIVLDQLSMVAVPDARIGYEAATAVSNGLRHLARDLRVPILVVSQVNRLSSKASDHLSIHDLKNSGEIENDAAGVLLIDKVIEPEGQNWRACEPVRTLQLLIGKNRYGPTTNPDSPIELCWWPRTCRIEESAGVEGQP